MARKAQPTKEDPKVEAAAGAEAETPEAPAEATQAAAGEMAHATEQDAQQPEEEAAEAASEEGTPAEDEAAEKPKPKTVSQPATRARMVDAKLKARHCRGGTCKEAGETMRMTAGEYERLKKHGRVE